MPRATSSRSSGCVGGGFRGRACACCCPELLTAPLRPPPQDATGCSAKAPPRPGSKRPQPFSANADELKVEVDALRVPVRGQGGRLGRFSRPRQDALLRRAHAHLRRAQELAAAGKLQNLTVAALQKCMQVYGLPKSGTKAQLVERVLQHLRQD